MAVLPIRMAGDPVLRQKAKKVRTIDGSIQKLIDDMIETMRDAPGVGLAANQVGVSLRVIVIEVPAEEEDERSDAPQRELYTLINPQIVKRSGERRLDEGCLSVPGYKAAVPRSVSVIVKGLNRDGREVRIKAQDNLLAEALEHEIDHINGVLYIDHLESMDELVKLEPAPDEEDGQTAARLGESAAADAAAGRRATG
ncbi:MAG: peptide deformylase [Dehalococcoidia bacterium]|nr:peptide deformylase [Dehalococcoidia bacterium]